jgi:hypothetical protein
MTRHRSTLSGCILLALILLPALAHGQFAASDLEGVWHVYTRWDSPVSHDAGYDTVSGFEVGPTGTITPRLGGDPPG